jgi:hypothetical protein
MTSESVLTRPSRHSAGRGCRLQADLPADDKHRERVHHAEADADQPVAPGRWGQRGDEDRGGEREEVERPEPAEPAQEGPQRLNLCAFQKAFISTGFLKSRRKESIIMVGAGSAVILVTARWRQRSSDERWGQTLGWSGRARWRRRPSQKSAAVAKRKATTTSPIGPWKSRRTG